MLGTVMKWKWDREIGCVCFCAVQRWFCKIIEICLFFLCANGMREEGECGWDRFLYIQYNANKQQYNPPPPPAGTPKWPCYLVPTVIFPVLSPFHSTHCFLFSFSFCCKHSIRWLLIQLVVWILNAISAFIYFDCLPFVLLIFFFRQRMFYIKMMRILLRHIT